MTLKKSLSGSSNPVWLSILCLILITSSLFLRLEKDEEYSTPAVQIFVESVGVSSVNSKKVVIINDEKLDSKIDLSGQMEYFFDENGRFPDGFKSIGETGVKFKQSFRPGNGKTHWGVHSEVCWFRITITSDLDQDQDFYASNLVDHKLFTLKSGQSVCLYYRLQYDDAGIVCTPSISGVVLHNKKITNRLIYSSILLGLYIGLFLYNLVLAFLTKNNTYPPYLFGLLFFGLYLLFREFPVSFGSWNIASASFSLPGYLCILLFTRNFFHLSNEKKALLWGFYALLFLGIFSLYMAVVSSSYGTIMKYIFSIFLLGYAFWISINHYSRNKKMTIFYLLSWGPALICLIFSLLVGLQIFNFKEGSMAAFLGSNPSMYLQIAFQMVSLSIVLGDQINREKWKAILANREREELRLQNSLRKDFILYISHEIRTTLALFSGSLEGLRKGRFGKIGKNIDSCLISLQNNEKQLEEYVSNLLIFTRINTQKESFKRAPQNISEMLYFLASNYSSLAETHNINYQILINRLHPCAIENNRHLFELMIKNLLSNAFKFTKEGGRITVDISKHTENSCCITITNTGDSIPLKEQKNIFSKFNKLTPGIEGMGLGLHMAQQCAELLDGRIEVSSIKGLTSFIIYFPITKEEIAPEAVPISYNKKNPVEREGLETLLLVEDNGALLEMIKKELESEFTVYIARDGQEALELIQDSLNPDLIISDILMPRMDGITFFKTVRIKERHYIPFIFLSAIDNEQDRQKLYELGAVDFLNKPFNLSTLTIKVRNLLLWKSEELVRQKEDLKSAVLAVFNNKQVSTENPELEMARKIKQYKLSRREEQTLKGVLKGLLDKEIAVELNLATSTISNHLQKVYRKTGTQGRTSLMYLFSSSSS